VLGTDEQGNEVRIPPHGETVLIMGAKGVGKSELATQLMNRLATQGYSFCVIDVQGDYGTIAKAVSLGSPSRPPTANEILKLLQGADKSAVVNLSGLSTSDRLPFLADLTPKLAELRARSGHPHWVVVDETEELPSLGDGESVLHITERPTLIAREVVQATNLVIALGSKAQALLDEFCQVRGIDRPEMRVTTLRDGEALAWWPGKADARPFRLNTATPQQDAATAGGSGSGVGKPGSERAARARTGSLH